MDARKSLLTSFYRAIDDRDLEAVMSALHAEADILDQLDGGRRRGNEALRDYWTGIFSLIRSQNALKDFRTVEGGDMEATVHHHVTSPDGALWHEGPVRYRFAFRDGLIARVDRVETP